MNCEHCRSFQSVTATSLDVLHEQIVIETICCSCHKHTTTRYEAKVIFQQTISDLPKGSFVIPTEYPNQDRFPVDDEHVPNDHA